MVIGIRTPQPCVWQKTSCWAVRALFDGRIGKKKNTKRMNIMTIHIKILRNSFILICCIFPWFIGNQQRNGQHNYKKYPE